MPYRGIKLSKCPHPPAPPHSWGGGSDKMRRLKEMTRRARMLRNEPTEAEAILWEYLRKGRLMGFKFRRQHVVRKYILDFFCPEANLAIEIDGEIHKQQKGYDKFRMQGLNGLGIHILRFPNDAVYASVGSVVAKISLVLKNLQGSTPPPRAGEAGRGT